MFYLQKKLTADHQEMLQTETQAPGFLRDIHTQDKILNELNINDELQKEIFYKLCIQWQPSLDLEKNLNRLSCSKAGNKEIACRLLFEKLEYGHYGKIVTTYTEPQPGAEKLPAISKLVLTERDSPAFFTAYIQDLLAQQYIHPGTTNLPFKELIEKDTRPALSFPPELCQKLALEKLSPRLIKKQVQPVFFLVPMQNKHLVCPSTLFLEFITTSKMIIRRVFTDMGNEKGQKAAELIAKTNNLSFPAFRQSLLVQDPDWKTITEQINRYLQKCKAEKQPWPELHPSTWQALSIIFYYARNQAAEAAQEKQVIEKLKNDMQAIENQIKNASRLLSQEDIDTLLKVKEKDYGQKFTAFCAEFFRQYTDRFPETATTKKTLSVRPIIYLDPTHIIHIDRLADYTAVLLQKLNDKMYDELCREMKHFIKHPDDLHPFLNNAKAYTEHLGQQVKEKIPLLHTILTQNLNLLLTSAETHDKSSEIRKLVKQFFFINSEGIYKIKPWEELLELSITKLFENAFSELHPLTQFIYKKINGRYDSLYVKFSRIAGKTVKNTAPIIKEKSVPPQKSKTHNIQNSKPAQPATVAKKTPTRIVTEKEKKQATDAFAEALKKLPQNPF